MQNENQPFLFISQIHKNIKNIKNENIDIRNAIMLIRWKSQWSMWNFLLID